MTDFDRKKHWEKIYSRMAFEEVSWYQSIPHVSLELIEKYTSSGESAIIDIGGGESRIAENLITNGYKNVSVLDISAEAIRKSRLNLGDKADSITWIESDVCDFIQENSYDIWHDRAAFHFLTKDEDIKTYVRNLTISLKPGGIFIVGTFASDGPEKCSGVEIRRYSPALLQQALGNTFEKLECHEHQHSTPSGAVQNFIFCVFRKNLNK
ncbi:MAG: class I SAM-dependent methyltransferase [Bacteroidales bacterium]|nr:class I SAM-dependent methyltransferase [Bacteroidales bacterium]